MDKRAWTYLRTLALAALLGFPVAVAAVLFQTAIHDVIHFVWEVVPHWLDWSEPAWWYVILVPALAGVLVALFLRLPGHGGHSPLEGVSTAPIQPIELPSILLAGLATLGLGLVLGPEAPLIALGLGLGAIAVRLVRLEQTEAQLLVLAGAFAAIAALFGGPLAASVMLLELVAMSGAIPAASIVRALLPGFVAAATGALVFTGVAGLAGAAPDRPVAAVATRLRQRAGGRPGVGHRPFRGHRRVVVGIRHLAHGVAAGAKRRPELALVVAGALVGVVAVVFRAVADRPVDLVLFSGQAEMPDVIAESSAWVLVLLVVAKGLACALSLGAGFRGGPVFPALAVGVALAMVAADVLPGLDTTPAVAIGLAAGTAAVLRAPFTGVLLATLLLGSSAYDVTPIAVFAAATGWLVAVALPNPEDRLREAADAPVGDDDAADHDRDQ